MANLPKSLKDPADPDYKTCALHGQANHLCDGRITREHAIIFAGKQLQERWAVIPLCAKGHEVDGWQDAGTMSKEQNVWVALNRATDEELLAVSKAINYLRERDRLNHIYGRYERKYPSAFDLPTKKDWYPLSQRDLLAISRAMRHHETVDNQRYSKHGMIAKMLNDYATSSELLEKLQG